MKPYHYKHVPREVWHPEPSREPNWLFRGLFTGLILLLQVVWAVVLLLFTRPSKPDSDN